MDFNPRNWRRTLLAIFVASLLIRGVFVLTLQDGFYFVDSISYSGAAHSLVTDGELGATYNRPPGYPVFLAAIFVLFGESILAIRMVESVMGALLAVIIALIGRRIGGEEVGTVAGMLWSIYPLGIFIAGLVYPTGLLATLLACSLLCFLPYSHQEPSAKRVFLAGVLLGLAALVIPIVLATVGAISLWLMYWSRVRRLLLVSLLFLGAALAVVPWMVRDYHVYGRLVVVEPRLVQHIPESRVGENNVQERRITAVLKQPGAFAARFGREFLRFWKVIPDRVTMDEPGFREKMHEKDPRVVKETVFSVNTLIKAVSILSTGPAFLFALIGIFAMSIEPERRRDLGLLCATILSFAVGYSIFLTQTRYRIPIEPYILILSAYGLWKTWSAVARIKYAASPARAEVRS